MEKANENIKLFHSLRFRFVALLSVFITALIGIMSVLEIRQMSNAVTETFAAQGIFIVEKAASLIDGDFFEALAKSRNSNGPFYEEIRIKLLELKDFSGCKYLYTMTEVSGTIWQYVIDGSAEPGDIENFSNLGDEEETKDYDDAFKRVLISGKTESGNLVYQEGWGWLVSFYIPIVPPVLYKICSLLSLPSTILSLFNFS
jgi:methyl-accepting chemotaxis protein